MLFDHRLGAADNPCRLARWVSAFARAARLTRGRIGRFCPGAADQAVFGHHREDYPRGRREQPQLGRDGVGLEGERTEYLAEVEALNRRVPQGRPHRGRRLEAQDGAGRGHAADGAATVGSPRAKPCAYCG
jgi:hypothetical protein